MMIRNSFPLRKPLFFRSLDISDIKVKTKVHPQPEVAPPGRRHVHRHPLQPGHQQPQEQDARRVLALVRRQRPRQRHRQRGGHLGLATPPSSQGKLLFELFIS